MVHVNRHRKLCERFIQTVVPLAASLALVITSTACTNPGPAPTDGIISGVVQGQDGPEAGVWVIAETRELGTRYIKAVVTDDGGHFEPPRGVRSCNRSSCTAISRCV